MKPITPQEAVELKLKMIPSELIEAINQLIAKEISPLKNKKHIVSIKKKDIIAKYLQLLNITDENLKRQKIDEIFDNKYLDIEEIFDSYGWKTTYYSPHYTEDSFDEHFKFVQK